MFAQTRVAEVYAQPATLSKLALERIRVRALQCDTIASKRRLSFPNVWRTLISRNVVADLSNEPRSAPANVTLRIMDHLCQILAI